ncbi:hypothetical protein BDV29DRAFT_165905 [Aspergillus leporis]|uniref:Uncharacterized protein n=1 Tax=Aspergillus leporis TaxID=41062 RepID=A0A5N5XD45_9EURO|nr:hypothetical protein BDV29DRAFT_165905 [Aspergillus leporis]
MKGGKYNDPSLIVPMHAFLALRLFPGTMGSPLCGLLITADNTPSFPPSQRSDSRTGIYLFMDMIRGRVDPRTLSPG